jgi:hypothetical protein
VFTEEAMCAGTGPTLWDYAYDADASWMAVPALPYVGAYAVTIVRDPWSTVKSMCDRAWFIGDGTQRYARVIRRHRREVFRWPDMPDRALAFWIEWNTAAVIGSDRLDNIWAPFIVECAAYCEVDITEDAADKALAEVSTSTNHLNDGMRRPYYDHRIDEFDFEPMLLDHAMLLWERWSHAGE